MWGADIWGAETRCGGRSGGNVLLGDEERQGDASEAIRMRHERLCRKCEECGRDRERLDRICMRLDGKARRERINWRREKVERLREEVERLREEVKRLREEVKRLHEWTERLRETIGRDEDGRRESRRLGCR